MLSFFKSDEDSFIQELMSNKVNKSKIEKYIQKGVDINKQDEKGRTILFTLANNKKFDSIKILLELGVDLYKEDKLGKTVLSEACEKYDLMMVRFFLDNGFDANKKNSHGRTILQDNVLLGNEKVFQILLNYDLDFDIKDNDGQTVLFDAVENGNLDILQKVIENIKDINSVDKNGQTALFKAILKDDLKIALTLIQKGININILDKYGQNVLFNTIVQGNKNNIILKHLINRGIDLNVIDKRDKSIIDEIFYIITLQKYDKDIEDKRYIQINSKDDYLSLALLIIEAGFKVDTPDKYGKTALQKEIDRRNFSNAEFLINCGASINILDENGRNLVHQEILKGYTNNKIIDFLISKGANLNQKDNYSKSIVDNLIDLILISKGEKEADESLAEYVQEDGGFDILLRKVLSFEADINYTRVDGKNLVFELVKYDSFDVLDILVEYGIDVNCIDYNGKTPLMCMLDDGLKIEDKTLKAYFLKRLQNFLKYRVSLDIQDKDGKTVIHKAVIADDVLVVEKLMIKKANLNIKDNHGRTALHHTQWKGNYQIARWLISAGADMNIPDNSGFNILNYAAILGHTRLVITLISSGVLMYNNHPKNRKIAQFFKSKEKMLDKLIEAEVSDNKMKNALVEVVINFKKEIEEALA